MAKRKAVVKRVPLATIEDALEVGGLQKQAVADRLGLHPASVSLKVAGHRPWFEDELVAVADLISAGGRLVVTADELVAIVGPDRVQVRGTVASRS